MCLGVLSLPLRQRDWRGQIHRKGGSLVFLDLHWLWYHCDTRHQILAPEQNRVKKRQIKRKGAGVRGMEAERQAGRQGKRAGGREGREGFRKSNQSALGNLKCVSATQTPVELEGNHQPRGPAAPLIVLVTLTPISQEHGSNRYYTCSKLSTLVRISFLKHHFVHVAPLLTKPLVALNNANSQQCQV